MLFSQEVFAVGEHGPGRLASAGFHQGGKMHALAAAGHYQMPLLKFAMNSFLDILLGRCDCLHPTEFP
jgi:hypothetical protein